MKFLIAIVLAFVGISAEAVEVEASIGSTVFTKPSNTIWYQQEFPHQFDLQSVSYSIGVTDYLTSSTRWRVAYTRLGQVSSVASATSDDQYSHGCRHNCPMNTYRTEGSVRGFSFTVAPETQIGSVKVFAEAGAFVFLPKFIATIDGCSISTQQYSEGWKVGPQIGVGAEYRNMQIVLTGYRVDSTTSNVDAVPNWQGWAVNLALRKRF